MQGCWVCLSIPAFRETVTSTSASTRSAWRSPRDLVSKEGPLSRFTVGPKFNISNEFPVRNCLSLDQTWDLQIHIGEKESLRLSEGNRTWAWGVRLEFGRGDGCQPNRISVKRRASWEYAWPALRRLSNFVNKTAKKNLKSGFVQSQQNPGRWLDHLPKSSS